MTLEEVQQTDSVLVGNLNPGTSPDVLSLYFECRGGNQMVAGVTTLSESTAKVSFVDHDCKFCVICNFFLNPLVLSLDSLVTGFSSSMFIMFP